ncbi:FAD-binding oxidoreductase [Georgenia ruanii]|uniref:FAD-binding oxidoreductase n=1 Tax=Georgenia ruanii TaxID=348442 RepID=UPI001D007667|nr:FAD-binding oxidoreductase [Georgenia ruanii]
MSTSAPGPKLEALTRRVGGAVCRAGDPGYEEARRVWNGMVDRRPLAVVRAATAGDIGAVVEFAKETGLPLAVRGGGHGVAGNGTVDGGIVLDLGSLDFVSVDPGSGTVRAEPGATIADVDAATAVHDLAVPLGVVSTTGIAGLTLGGGIGWLTRAHGLSIDNLLAADVVTAGGGTLHASAEENPDLFWGIRGGGGNFGVVSAFTFRADPLPHEVLAGNLVYGEERWLDALLAWEEWTRALPDAMQSIVTFFVPPPSWELGSEPLMVVRFAWAGPDHAEGAAVLAQLRAAARPDGEVVGPMAWTAWQSVADELFPRGSRAYWKNTSFDRMADDVVETLVLRAGEQRWRGTGFDIHHMGGAYGRVPEDATAFPTRAARFWLNVYGYWQDAADDGARVAFVRGLATDMEPFATGGTYTNFLGAEAPGPDERRAQQVDRRAQAAAVWGPDALERLVALKRRYDPGNLFHLNHNIPPT